MKNIQTSLDHICFEKKTPVYSSSRLGTSGRVRDGCFVGLSGFGLWKLALAGYYVAYAAPSLQLLPYKCAGKRKRPEAFLPTVSL